MIRRKRRKGFLEDFLVIVVILAIAYAVYFFAFADDESNEPKTITSVTKENRFLTNIYEEIKESLFSNFKDEEDEIVLKSKEELEEEFLNKGNYLNYTREEVFTIRNESKIIQESEAEKELILTDDSSNKELVILEEKNIEEDNKPIPTISNDEINSEQIVKETNSSVNIRKSNEFFSNFRKKVNQNIKNSIPKSSLDLGKSVDIRVTILKDGSFEELIYVDGSLYNFEMVKEQIEAAFPLVIDKSIESIFPRYYRMTINF